MATEYRLPYTASQINAKLGKIDSLAEKSEIPVKTSDLTNDSGFITENYVKGYAQPVGNYALKDEIPTIPVTSVNGKTGTVVLDAASVGALPSDTEIPTVPVNVSAFTNDAGYLTEHQSLEDYAKTEDLGNLATKDIVSKEELSTEVQASLGKADTALQSYTETDPTVPAWAKAENKPSYTADEVGARPDDWMPDYSDVGALPNTTTLKDLAGDADHRTVTDNEKVAWNAKAEVSDIPTKTSELTNDSCFLTEHQSLDGLATEEYADNAAALAASSVKSELLNGAGEAYDTLKELADLINENEDAIDALNTVAAGKADKATTLAGYGITDAYTSQEIDEKIDNHNNDTDAHTNMGWLTSEDEVADSPVPFDADTLNGYTAAHFDDQIAVERARINSLMVLEEGSTTGDAELQDIRVGFDGTVYETAGDAVRAQGVKITVEPLDENGQPIITPEGDKSPSLVVGNKEDTVFDFPATAGKLLDIRAIYNLADHGGVTRVDWGDGTVTDIVGKTDDEMKHTYKDAGTYTVTVSGMKILNYAFRSKGITRIIIGSTVQEITAVALTENTFTEVTIYAETPPTLGASSPFDTSVTNIYVPNESYLTAPGWSTFASKLVVTDFDGDSDSNNDFNSEFGYKLTVAKATGTDALYLYHGTPGNDGISPTISVDEIEGGNRLTITDKNGTQSVDILNGKQGEDTTSTKVTMSIADGYTLDIRAIYNLENHGGVTYVDWGDGNANAVVGSTDDEMKHHYATGGTYTITLAGIVKIPTFAFRAKPVIELVIGSSVAEIERMAFNETQLTEVTLHAATPPVLSNVSDTTAPFDAKNIKAIYVPTESVFEYTHSNIWKDYYADAVVTKESLSCLYSDKVVTVGASGDFDNLNDAIAYLSQFYPTYKKGGINCYIKILAGTTINEQVYANQIDLQYITIIAEPGTDNTETITIDGTSHTFVVVDVDATGFGHTANAHDARGNYPFIAGENAAKLPTIGCVFRLLPNTVESGKTVCGMLCNRGSEGVVLAASGFDGFYDGVIANNESSITIREGISRNMGRWGVHARHNGEVSARSCICTNCGVAACADRVADLDVREAVLDGSTVAIECNNISRANANGCHANNCGSNGGYVVMVSGGGIANCGSLETNGNLGSVYNVAVNTFTAGGIIFA